MRIDKNPYGWSLEKESQKAKPADEPTESKLGFISSKILHTVCSITLHAKRILDIFGRYVFHRQFFVDEKKVIKLSMKKNNHEYFFSSTIF